MPELAGADAEGGRHRVHRGHHRAVDGKDGGHPLCDGRDITPANLHGVPLIMTGHPRPRRVALDHMFDKAGVRPPIEIEIHTDSAACAFVARGLGVSIVSSLFANLFRDFPIDLRRFRPRSTRSFGRLRDKDVPLPLAARRIGEILKRELTCSQLPLDELLSNGRWRLPQLLGRSPSRNTSSSSPARSGSAPGP
ncbi:hypothetical protein HC022_07225 [Salipiger sp. HF18]|uniref:LysR substrate-binding domain-containing protein n=1 Tax=Salipiger sp. HF18 TaxID=2721557 RepID=UPI00142D7FC1|nr:hypothetical protein [Salipiger sp. HF18]